MNILGITLNYADIIVIVVVIIAAIVGWCRGIAVTIVNFIRTAVGLFLCFYASSNLAQGVYDGYVKQRCLDTINEKIATTANVDEVIANLNDFSASLPLGLSKLMNVSSLDLTSENLSEAVLNNVFEPVAMFAIKVIIFLVVFVLFFGLTGLIILLIRKAAKKKSDERGHETVLKKTDRALGLLFGLLKAGVLVLALTSVFMYVLSVKPEFSEHSAFWLQVSQSRLLEILNEINPFNAITEGLI